MRANKKYSLDEVKKEFILSGLEPLFESYVNNKEKLYFKCSKGHRHYITLSDLKRGKRCGLCASNKKPTLEEVKKEFIAAGYIPLFEDYKSNKQKLKFKCSRKHTHSISLSSLRSGQRCALCRIEDKKVPLEKVLSLFYKKGYTPKFKIYSGASSNLPFICSRGHENTITLSSLQKGHGCSICSREDRRLEIQDVHKEFVFAGHQPLFDQYTDQMSLLPFKCDRGHEHHIRLHNLRRGQACGVCAQMGVSGAEKDIREHFTNLGIVLELNTREIIPPYELDIYFPEHKLAVEYCGLYWHSEISGNKDRKYHYTKRHLCEKQGIRLITIFEDEYITKKEVVLSRIENALGIASKRIYARKCKVKKVDRQEALRFLNMFHLQGSGRFNVAFGIFYDSQLVGVMTGGFLTRRHVSNKKVLEMKRLCFSPNCAIAGGASKLFKTFLLHAEENNYEAIRSYQDMRYGNPYSSVYENLNFKFISETKYTPHYVGPNHKKRYRNQSLRKTPEERLTGKTEWELRQEQGFDRIWDCGHRTYEYTIKKQ